MAQIRLWTLGSIENKVFPTIKAINRLAELLGKMDLTKDNDIVWDDTLRVHSFNTDGTTDKNIVLSVTNEEELKEVIFKLQNNKD